MAKKQVECDKCKGTGKVEPPDPVKELQEEIKKLKKRVKEVERQRPIIIPQSPPSEPVYPKPYFPQWPIPREPWVERPWKITWRDGCGPYTLIPGPAPKEVM